ncbi:MAG TPA: hypothetical protein VFT66_01510 [Roseiflexaceae bacterium]|jgi:hypothetical protein|nr:hypothetical protein [Roseiflexaceae bacterium]
MADVFRPMTVRSEHDVVVLRQRIREAGRATGLTLTQQAKLTTAVSTITRRLLLRCSQIMCGIAMDEQNQSPMFVVECRFTEQTPADGAQAGAHALELHDVQALVDEASVARASGEALLILRMRIAA